MANPKKKDWARTKAYKELRNDLEQGLKASGLDTPKYRDLVDEYMISWCQLKELNMDIEDRGTRVSYQNGSQSGVSENKSLGTKIRLLKSMDDIFRRLGYQDEAKVRRSAAAQLNAGGDDDEL